MPSKETQAQLDRIDREMADIRKRLPPQGVVDAVNEAAIIQQAKADLLRDLGGVVAHFQDRHPILRVESANFYELAPGCLTAAAKVSVR